jgi:hypothetical protein
MKTHTNFDEDGLGVWFLIWYITTCIMLIGISIVFVWGLVFVMESISEVVNSLVKALFG